MKRINERKARNMVHRWMKNERATKYATAHDGYAKRLNTFRKVLGF